MLSCFFPFFFRMLGDYVQTQEKKATKDERPKNEAEPPRAMEADAKDGRKAK